MKTFSIFTVPGLALALICGSSSFWLSGCSNDATGPDSLQAQTRVSSQSTITETASKPSSSEPTQGTANPATTSAVTGLSTAAPVKTETADKQLRGRILLKDGGPASGAEVSLQLQNYVDGAIQLTSVDGTTPTLTAADGSFSLPSPELRELPGQRRLLRVARKGSATIYFFVSEKNFQEFTLEPAAALRGLVVDEAGKPVTSATVTALLDLQPLADPAGVSHGENVTRSDGSFTFDDLLAGHYHMRVEAGNFAADTRSVDVPTTTLKVVLTKGTSSIRGHVFNFLTREAISGSTVTARLIGGAYRQGMPSPAITTVTDDMGGFAFGGLAKGEYMLNAVHGKWRQVPPEDKNGRVVAGTGEPILASVKLEANQSTEGLALYLYPGHTITGLVRDKQTSSPVDGITVHVSERAGGAEAVSDSAGRFRLEGVFADVANIVNLGVKGKKGYRLADDSRAISPYMVQSNTPQVKLSRDNMKAEAVVEVIRSATVSGTVKTSNGTPVEGAQVMLRTNRNGYGGTDAKTNRAGFYEIEVEPFQSITAMARHEDYALGYSRTVQVDDEPVSGVDVLLSEGTTISGRVTDPDGMPVEGATVRGFTMVQSYGDSLPEVKTDPDGSFILLKVPPRSPIRISAAKAGFAPSVTEAADMTSGQPKNGVELKLRPSRFVTGRVVDADGKPLSGASVNGHSQANDGGYANAQTDADGRYRLDGFAEGPIYVTASVQIDDRGYTDTKNGVKADQENVDFILGSKSATASADRKKEAEKGITFIGRVVDHQTGEPIADFTFSGMGSEKVEKDPSGPGRFLIKNFKPGTVRLQLEAPGYLPLQTPPLNAGGDGSKNDQTFRLGPGGVVFGRLVQGEAKSPAANVPVLLNRGGDEWQTAQATPDQHGRTDAEGRFRFERVEPGQTTLYFRPKEPLVHARRLTSAAHGQETDLGDITLSEGGRVHGRLLQSPGDTPLAKVTVQLNESQGGSDRHETVTDDQGQFSFEGVKGATYSLHVREYSLYSSFVLSEGATKEIVLRIGSVTLTGRVLRGSEGVRGSVQLALLDGSSKSASTDQSGAYKLKGVPPGRWDLTAYAYGSSSSGAQVQETVEIPADVESVEKDIHFPASRILGRVVDAEDKPVPGAAISAQPKQGRSAYDSFLPETVSAESDLEGRFTIEGLSPGTYGLSGRKDGKIGMAQGVTVPEQGDSPEVLLRLGAGGGKIVSTALNLSTGAPIPEAWLILSNESGRFDHGQSRNSEGTLTVENIPPGKYMAQISSFGFSVNEREIEVKEDETTKLDDVLYDAGALRWNLQDANGSPLKNVTCRLTPDDPNSIETERQGTNSANGMWVVRGLFPGTYTATGTAPGGSPLTAKITIIAHEVTEVTTKAGGN